MPGKKTITLQAGSPEAPAGGRHDVLSVQTLSDYIVENMINLQLDERSQLAFACITLGVPTALEKIVNLQSFDVSHVYASSQEGISTTDDKHRRTDYVINYSIHLFNGRTILLVTEASKQDAPILIGKLDGNSYLFYRSGGTKEFFRQINNQTTASGNPLLSFGGSGNMKSGEFTSIRSDFNQTIETYTSGLSGNPCFTILFEAALNAFKQQNIAPFIRNFPIAPRAGSFTFKVASAKGVSSELRIDSTGETADVIGLRGDDPLLQESNAQIMPVYIDIIIPKGDLGVLSSAELALQKGTSFLPITGDLQNHEAIIKGLRHTIPEITSLLIISTELNPANIIHKTMRLNHLITPASLTRALRAEGVENKVLMIANTRFEAQGRATRVGNHILNIDSIPNFPDTLKTFLIDTQTQQTISVAAFIRRLHGIIFQGHLRHNFV